MEVLRGDAKFVVEADDGSRHVYTKHDDGNYKWDHEESAAQQFPSSDVKTAIADRIDGEVLDHFPLTVTMYAHDDSNTQSMCRHAGLPTDDDDLIELLWNYPGEFEVTYEFTRGGRTGYSVEAKEIKYEGKRFTPE